MGTALTIEQLQLLQRRGGPAAVGGLRWRWGWNTGHRNVDRCSPLGVDRFRAGVVGGGAANRQRSRWLDPAAPAAMYPQPPGSPRRSSAPSWRLAAPRCLPCAGAACSRSVAIWCLRTPPPAVRICFDIGIAAPLCFAPAHLPAEVPSPCLPLRRPTTLCFIIRTLTQPLTPQGLLRRASTESGVWACVWARRVAWDREHL
jgi:hypothetical protein